MDELARARREDYQDDLGRCEAILDCYKDRTKKLEALVKQMWAGIDLTIKENTNKYVGMAAPDIVRKMKALDLWRDIDEGEMPEGGKETVEEYEVRK